jgi:hypothetical protein
VTVVLVRGVVREVVREGIVRGIVMAVAARLKAMVKTQVVQVIATMQSIASQIRMKSGALVQRPSHLLLPPVPIVSGL